jgi:hypothetical protein
MSRRRAPPFLSKADEESPCLDKFSTNGLGNIPDHHGVSATRTGYMDTGSKHHAPGFDARKTARTRNGGRHRCQPPLSGHVPPRLRFLSSRPASLAISSPNRTFCGAHRNNPATVWSAPFRGPAAPESSSSSSKHLSKQSLFQRWAAFLSRSGSPQLVGIAAFRDQGIDRLPRWSGPFSSGWSCNHPSCPGGPTSWSSDDLKLT